MAIWKLPNKLPLELCDPVNVNLTPANRFFGVLS